MADKPPVDWESIEGDYRAGVLSLREIATSHGITHGAINKRAKRDGWDRDLSAKIKARAEALVSKALVSTEVSIQRAVTERQVIEANAERIAQVQGGHRATGARLHALALTLLTELEGQSADVESLAKLGELLRKPDDKGVDKLNDLYQKIISTPSRVDSAKKIAETARHAIGLEREAYGLDDKKTQTTSPGEITISF